MSTAKANWLAVKQEYATTNKSAKEIADEVGVSIYTVQDHMKREDWSEARRAYQAGAATRVVEVAENRQVFSASAQLLKLDTVMIGALDELKRRIGNDDVEDMKVRELVEVCNLQHKVRQDLHDQQKPIQGLLETMKRILTEELGDEQAEKILKRVLED